MEKMMKILSENKRKEQFRQKQLKETKEHAKDILALIWMIFGLILYFELLALL